MKLAKVKPPVVWNEIGSMENERVYYSRGADGVERFELQLETFYEPRGDKWVPRESDDPKSDAPVLIVLQRRAATRLEVLRWFVNNWIPAELRRYFRPVTHPRKGGVR